MRNNASNLLHQLRIQLHETSSTAAIVAITGGAASRRRRNRRDAVDQLVGAAQANPSLAEACLLWTETRSKIRAAGQIDHPVYRSTLSTLESRLPTLTEREAIDLHENVEPLLDTADSTGLMSDEFTKIHKRFVDNFASKFKVEITRWDPVAEGLYFYTGAEDTTELAHKLEEIRHYAQKHSYIMIKKGTTDDTRVGTDDAQWGFIYDQNQTNQKEFDNASNAD